MDRRDMFAVPIVLVLAVAVTLGREQGAWRDTTTSLVTFAVGICACTLLYHFDWSRFSRLRSKRPEHL